MNNFLSESCEVHFFEMNKIEDLSDTEIIDTIRHIYNELQDRQQHLYFKQAQARENSIKIPQIKDHLLQLSQQCETIKLENEKNHAKFSQLTLLKNSIDLQKDQIVQLRSQICPPYQYEQIKSTANALPDLPKEIEEKCLNQLDTIFSIISSEFTLYDSSSYESKISSLKLKQQRLEHEIQQLTQLIESDQFVPWDPVTNYDIILNEFYKRISDSSSSTLSSNLPNLYSTSQESQLLESFSPQSNLTFTSSHSDSFDSLIHVQNLNNEKESKILQDQLKYFSSLHDEFISHPLSEKDLTQFWNTLTSKIRSARNTTPVVPISIDQCQKEENQMSFSELVKSFAVSIPKITPRAQELFENCKEQKIASLSFPTSIAPPQIHVTKNPIIDRELGELIVHMEKLKQLLDCSPPPEVILSLVSSHSEALKSKPIKIPELTFEENDFSQKTGEPLIPDSEIPDSEINNFRNLLYRKIPANDLQDKPTLYHSLELPDIPNKPVPTSEEISKLFNEQMMKFHIEEMEINSKVDQREEELNRILRNLSSIPSNDIPPQVYIAQNQVEIEKPDISQLFKAFDDSISIQLKNEIINLEDEIQKMKQIKEEKMIHYRNIKNKIDEKKKETKDLLKDYDPEECEKIKQKIKRIEEKIKTKKETFLKEQNLLQQLFISRSSSRNSNL